MQNLKRYTVSVVCSDSTTFCKTIIVKAKKEATMFAQGVEALYKELGKTIYNTTVKPNNYEKPTYRACK